MTTKRHDILPSPGFSDDDSAPASNLSSMQRAIVTIQKLRAKVESLERARTEAIAIVGMGCRFPGGANTPEAFFQLLEAGVDAVTEVPSERWPLERESADSEGEQRSLRWGAFLKDVDRFDAAFFGISPREAESLDPQQRLLLEVTWEALERAGQLPERLMGSKTGVFVGIWSLDYQQRVIALEQEKLDAYCFTGNVLSTAAGRLAYTLGLQGPCMSVETACSSSLTAIHLACQSLRSGETSMALAGGVNLMLSPTTTKLLSKTQALSPDGRCKTFDARANGFVRGEGCGILVLKRLSDAERDGDTILALIRGSAVNQDGRSTGLTAPNVLSQQALLKQALENARLSPQDIAYLETHGTGTSLGDPIEVEAIKAVLGGPRERGATCVLGAVKTNIGHLEAAAGVAGVMKVVLALQNDRIPGNLHFRSLNPRIDLKNTSLEIAQESRPWTSGVRSRIAGVSSFGISGTNAHVILEEAPRNLEEALLGEELVPCLLPISARTPEALRDLARAYHRMLVSPQSPRLVDIVHTASARRTHYLHRLSIVGNTKDELATQLAAFVEGNKPTGVAEGQSTPARAKVVFVFSGQGAQWLGMGRQLYESDASFRSVIDTCDNLMTARLGWSILDELDSTEAASRLSETQVAQPLLFAVQIALVEMLRSWGIAPDAMIGHSVGEIAAAHIAGILSLDEAIRLVTVRGRVMQKATGMGKMVSVSMTAAQARTMMAGYEDRIAIAAINDPNSLVLSGSPSAIDDVIVRCEKHGYTCRPVRVNYAFHSPQMDPFERELVDRLVRVDTRRATLAMYSTVFAECVDGKELDVRYWGRNIRETVDFAGAVFAAIRDGYQLFLEIGPHPVLTTNIQQCIGAKKADGLVTFTMRRNQNQRSTLLEAAGGLYTRGCLPEWSRIVPTGGRSVALPTYPWQKERYWIEQVTIPFGGQTSESPDTHPLLGPHSTFSTQPGVHFWTRKLHANAPAWIAEHVVQDNIVFPGAGYVEMALSAATSIFKDRPFALQDVNFAQMLTLASNEARTVQTVFSPKDDDSYSFQIASKTGTSESWDVHAIGTIRASTAVSSIIEAPEVWPVRNLGIEMAGDDHYRHMVRRGISVGPSFQGLEHMWYEGEDVVGVVRPKGSVIGDNAGYRVHPALLDACFQVLLGLLVEVAEVGTFVPAAIERIHWYHDLGDETWVRIKLHPSQNTSSRTLDMVFTDANGRVAAEFLGFRVQRVTTRPRRPSAAIDDCLFSVAWQLKNQSPSRAATLPKTGRWLIFGDAGGLGTKIGSQLRQWGADYVEVTHGDHYTRLNANHYALDYSVGEHYTRLIRDEFAKNGELRGVIHLSSLDATALENSTHESLRNDTKQIVSTALFITQAILRQNWRDLPRLVFITRGAQAVKENERILAPAGALSWGLGRTLALEHPALECLRVDLDASGQTPDVADLLNEIISTEREDQIAWREDRLLVPRLVRTSFDKARNRSLQIHADATYLVTGGLGGLGLSVAQWLSARGAKYIALLGRHEPSSNARAAIEQLEAAGTRVLIVHGDVGQASDVQEALGHIRQQMPPLRGIVHAAGVVDDHTVMELTPESMERVIAPKLYGVFNLHSCTARDSLDFMMLYSSAASLIGSPGQANYSAANASMDAFAHARTSMGFAATSIHWGPFSDVGMAASQANRGQRLAHRGLDSISPDEGTIALEHLLDRPQSEIGVIRFVPRQWLEFHPQAAAIPFFAEISKERKTIAKTQGKIRFREKLDNTNDADKAAALQRFVLEQLGNVVRVDPSRIDKNGSFTSLGVDSLMSLELRNKLESELEVKLAPTVFFTYASPDALSAYLLNQCQPVAKQAPLAAPPVAAPAPSPEEIESPKTPRSPTLEDDDLLAAFDASIQDLKTESPS